MSTIAAMLVLAAAPPGGAPMTAEQAMAAHAAATSIGPEPCRDPTGEEIVVCGRRESPYALPLPEAGPYDREAQAGGARARMTSELATATTACAMQLSTCRPPPAVDLFAVAPVLIKGVRRLIDGE